MSGLALVLLSACSGPDETSDSAGTTPPVSAGDADLVLGGLMYDSWYAAAEIAEPTGDFALYASTAGTQTGTNTFKCKECHGWDYLGVDGEYGDGSSRYTGVKGLLGSAESRSEQELFDLLKDGTPIAGSTIEAGAHAFSGWLDDDQILALVRFVREGLVDSRPYFVGGVAQGDAANGQELYDMGGKASCATCHGADGRAINFHEGEPEPEYVGTIAADEPTVGLHRLRWGVNESNPAMPSGVVDSELTIQEQIDVLAYAQTLPVN